MTIFLSISLVVSCIFIVYLKTQLNNEEDLNDSLLEESVENFESSMKYMELFSEIQRTVFYDSRSDSIILFNELVPVGDING